MYYKITNKESEVYKKLHEMRTNEIKMGEENKQAIKEKIGLEYDQTLGYAGQRSLTRVTEYCGFRFLNPEKVDLKVWRKDTDHPEIFVPNRRTNAGREMNRFLANGLKGSRFDKPLRILGLEHYGRFQLPVVEIIGDVIFLSLDNKMQPNDENIIEITYREYQEIWRDVNNDKEGSK